MDFYDLKTSRLIKNTFLEHGSYNVANKNIDTRNNEKKLIENLVKKQSDKIIKRLREI